MPPMARPRPRRRRRRAGGGARLCTREAMASLMSAAAVVVVALAPAVLLVARPAAAVHVHSNGGILEAAAGLADLALGDSTSMDMGTGMRQLVADSAETDVHVHDLGERRALAGARSACPGRFGRCSDRGYCAHGQCICQAGWTGIDCSLRAAPVRCVNGRLLAPTADGGASATTASASACECIDGWAGADCTLRVCPGPGGNCNGHGICLGTQCRCVAGFAGADCRTALCEDDCSAHGRCVDSRCRCDAGFAGELCETELCPAGCSGHGFCEAGGRCRCVPGFTGTDCGTPLCLTAVEGSPCSGHGRCVQRSNGSSSGGGSTSAARALALPGLAAANGTRARAAAAASGVLFQCQCDARYTGADCSRPDCSGVGGGGVGGGCGPHGTCVAGGRCECEPGYHGDACRLRSCPNDCGWTHGYCDADAGVCHCKPGFAGPDCADRTCSVPFPDLPDAAAWAGDVDDGGTGGAPSASSASSSSSSSAAASSPFSSPWLGLGGEVLLTTAQREARRCSGHGSCDAAPGSSANAGSCECRAPWDGQDCSYRPCPNACSGTNGYCFLGECYCRPGFAGSDCGRRVCPDDCSGHGACIEGSCFCSAGWGGPSCAAQTCMPHNCSGRGTCQEDGACLCEPGFDGVVCELALCKRGCSGHGLCGVDGQCRCHESWQGDDCSERVCPGSPTPCSARGLCSSATGACQCFSEFTGLACELRVEDVCVHPADRSATAAASAGGAAAAQAPRRPGPGRGGGAGRDATLVQSAGVGNALWSSSDGARSWASRPRAAFVRHTVCSGYGACGPRGNCSCFPGFTGVFCERSPDACGDHCSGHGICAEAPVLPAAAAAGTSATATGAGGGASRLRGGGGSGAAAVRSNRTGGVRAAAVAPEVSLDLVDRATAFQCVCEEAWVGRYCQNRQCPNACSGHGVCLVQSPSSSSPSSSSVSAAGTGTAGGTASAGSRVFSPAADARTSTARRQVIGTLSCFCDAGFGGPDCARPQPAACGANGTDGGDGGETVCSGHGVCGRGACFCEDGFAGDRCQLRRCPGQCSGHGVCDPNTATCRCEPSWGGEAGDCATPQCPRNCSGNGWCTTIRPDAVAASSLSSSSSSSLSLSAAGTGGLATTGGGGIAGRRGAPTHAELLHTLPAEPFAPTFARVVNLQAADHGNAYGAAAGPTVVYRDAALASDAMVAHADRGRGGRGGAGAQCLCRPGFDGDDCSLRACHPACVPPQCFCSAEGVAYCARGWSGPACTRRLSPAAAAAHAPWLPPAHGGPSSTTTVTFSSSGQRLPPARALGTAATSECRGGCGANGICVRTEEKQKGAATAMAGAGRGGMPAADPHQRQRQHHHCYCADGWGGANCEAPLPKAPCPFNCSNHGACVDGRCQCAPGYRGDVCDDAAGACPGSAGPCSGHGFCLSSGRCSCDALDYASSLHVDGRPPESLSAAAAAAPGDAGAGAGDDGVAVRGVQVWFGRDCSCAVPCAPGSHCQDGHCVCPPGRTGAGCATPACLGGGNCNGRGDCREDGSCACDSGFGGPGCADKVCHPSCTRHGAGTCRAGVCRCNDPAKLEVAACQRGWASLSTQERVATVLNDYRSLLTAQFECEALLAAAPATVTTTTVTGTTHTGSGSSVAAGVAGGSSAGRNASSSSAAASSPSWAALEARLVAEISEVKSRVLMHLDIVQREAGVGAAAGAETAATGTGATGTADTGTNTLADGADAPASLALERQRGPPHDGANGKPTPLLLPSSSSSSSLSSSSAALAAADAAAVSPTEAALSAVVAALRQHLVGLPARCAGFAVAPAGHLQWNRLRFLLSPDSRPAAKAKAPANHGAPATASATASTSARLLLGGAGAGAGAGEAPDLPGAAAGNAAATGHSAHARFARNLLREVRFEPRDYGGCLVGCSGHGACLAARVPEDDGASSGGGGGRNSSRSQLALRYSRSPSSTDPHVHLIDGSLEVEEGAAATPAAMHHLAAAAGGPGDDDATAVAAAGSAESNVSATGMWYEACVCDALFGGVGCHVRAACLPAASGGPRAGVCHGHGTCAGAAAGAAAQGQVCTCEDGWGGADCAHAVPLAGAAAAAAAGGALAPLPHCVARCKAACQATCTPPPPAGDASSHAHSGAAFGAGAAPTAVRAAAASASSSAAAVLLDSHTQLDDRTVLPFMACFRTCASDCQERECHE